jgi:hypothetical protein
MKSPLRLLLVLTAVAALCFSVSAQKKKDVAPPPETEAVHVDLRGTIGQRKATMSIVFDGDTIAEASYKYDSEKDSVVATDNQFFQTTVLLNDDDGNSFHLHMRRPGGQATMEVKEMVLLDGTMDREELDLPVKMERVK